ncbi:MAG: toll/interleukin-1 receptor domain-containing protein [Thermodesulfobacteriota bacterium]|nr:toll/interleukin-1 receptor domain-containing protein [Thermodesulfobacteriota bacterium]
MSHRDSFKRTANEIKKSLAFYGISSFVAHEDIEPSEEWIKEIEKALFSMNALLALLSDGFSASVWTNQEVGVAFGRGKFILSVRLREDPQGFVGKFQALRSKGKNVNVDELCSQITAHLLNHPKTQEKMIASYFSAIRNMASFAESEKWAELLSSIKNVNESQANVLMNAYNDNPQAYGCFLLNGQRGKVSLASRINNWMGEKKYRIRNEKTVRI